MASRILGELDRDVANKIASKYDRKREIEAIEWIKSVVPREPASGDILRMLHSGVVLCKLVNAIVPGTIKSISTMNAPFKHRDNISNYIEALKSLGFNSVDLFDTSDLYEGKNVTFVIDNVLALRSFSEKRQMKHSVRPDNTPVRAATPVWTKPADYKAKSPTDTPPKQHPKTTTPKQQTSDYLSSQSTSVDEILGELDLDIRRKIECKYDTARELKALEWLSSIAMTPNKSHDLVISLKSGQILCKVLNRLFPGSIRKVNTSTMPFSQRENIANYLDACKSLGMHIVDLFDTQDLYEGKNKVAVIDHFYALSAFARRSSPQFKGPFIQK